MRSGLDNKRNVVILAVLAVMMVGALVYFARSMFGGSSPAPAPAQQMTTARNEGAAPGAGSRNGGGRAAEKLPPLEKLDPTLHPELMAGAEALEYSGTGRNIFSLVSEPPKIEQVKGPL